MISTMRRFVSSYRHSSLQRLPDSMWKIGDVQVLDEYIEYYNKDRI